MRGRGGGLEEIASPEIQTQTQTPIPLLLTPPSLMAGSLSLPFLLLFLLLLLLIVALLLFLCRPWRFFFSSSASTQTDEITRLLFSENSDGLSGRGNGPATTIDDRRQVIQIDDSENGSPVVNHNFVSRKQSYPVQPDTVRDGSTLLNYESDVRELRKTLKRTAITNWHAPDSKHIKHQIADFTRPFKDAKFQQISTLSLEVTSGPSSGFRKSIKSNDSHAELTIGRVPPSNVVLNDSEVSGKHAVVKFNDETQRWEITDLGSLNGTYLNSVAIHHPDVGSRKPGSATALSSGDVITFGTSSRVLVDITQLGIANFINHDIHSAGIGFASDPMSRRRGGRVYPMEDVGLCQYPLLGVEKFGLFGVFDGHGGSKAAETASKIFPENVVKILSQSGEREKVISSSDASVILQQAFALTEDQMKDHQYEGCTATTLLTWMGSDGNLFAQCANLGDSECVIYIGGKQVVMTQEHKVASAGERERMAKMGKPLEDGVTRIGGLNLCRMLGDIYAKSQDPRFIAEPYVSEALHVNKDSSAFALVASDGLWDVLRPNQAVNSVIKLKERFKDKEYHAQLIAEALVEEAGERRTQDNTTVVFIDFDTLRTHSSSTS